MFQNMSEQLKPTVVVELQKLTSDWPLDVIKEQNKEDRKVGISFVLYILCQCLCRDPFHLLKNDQLVT